MSLKVLYHGTDIISAKSIYDTGIIDVDCGSDTVDFGKGFYTTDDFKRAAGWARRKAKLRGCKPAVLTVFFDEAAAEPIIERFEDDLRWGRFIINNRNGSEYIRHVPFKENNLDRQYQITIGRIADVDVIEVAKELRKNNKTLESLSEIFNPEYPLQTVFHTQYATTFIRKMSYQYV